MNILKSIAVCAATLTALPAMAETLGTITATIDGEERTWFVNAQDDESQSAFIQPMPGMLSMTSFILWGNPGEDKVASSKDVLIVAAALLKGSDGIMPVAAKSRYLVNGFDEQWVALDEGQTEMTLTTVEQIDGGLHVAGTFSAQANYTKDAMLVNVDRSKTKEFSGSFDVTLPGR